MKKHTKKYVNREISWLSFNERVLQEAADQTVPLTERIKFLGIFSSNLDEFFRVRVATLKRMVSAGKKARSLIGENPESILNEIQNIVIKQQTKFDSIYNSILNELESNNIFIINEKQLTSEQENYVRGYFNREVRPNLFPIMIDDIIKLPELKDHSIYLAIRLHGKEQSHSAKYALIEVPTDILSRFLVLPQKNNKTYIILLDDVIRVGLEDIFSTFGFTVFDAYTIKLTRDAELDIDNDITISFVEKISKSLKQRKSGTPVRFIYDSTIPKYFFKKLFKTSYLNPTDSLIPGGKYHNFKDFMNFPSVGPTTLQNKPLFPLPHRDFSIRTSLFDVIREKDVLLIYPYQSFHYLIDLLREASIDPEVTSIKITLYRVAKHSSVVNALINAIRNGKSVTVVMELQARFDEEANIYWTNRLREEGAKIIHGVPNLKVHSKLCLITRKENDKQVHYVNIGTGNYNEFTARVYSDHSLFTSDRKIAKDVRKIFDFFDNNYKTGKYKQLVVSPFFMRNKFITLIKNEIENARKGKKAYIILKLNHLVDTKLIDCLYRANMEGVKIDLIIRTTCSLIPGVKGLSENIRAISIIDRFLEHSRIFVFYNGGDEKYFISSADWMVRNLDHRIEVACPIYDKKLQSELKNYLDIQFKDNTKARILNEAQDNPYVKGLSRKKVSAQFYYYQYLKAEINNK